MFGCDSAATALASRSNRWSACRDPGDGRRQHLDRDVPVELRPRPVHLAHPARAERRKDLVGAESRAEGEGHCVVDYRGCRRARQTVQ